MAKVRRFPTVLHLDDRFTSVAELVASRYGIPIQLLVEALLLSCLNADEEEQVWSPAEAAPIVREPRKPKRRVWGPLKRPAKVVSLRAERTRRRDRPAATESGWLSACAAARAAARKAREQATVIREKAARARDRASLAIEMTEALLAMHRGASAP